MFFFFFFILINRDIVKLTAQFVARNGRQFLTNLMNREQRNFQFDFLRPQHSLFQYFTKLLEQYTKVLIPPKDLLPRLRDETSSMDYILEQVKYRAEWLKYQEAQRRREEEELERERVAYAQIDWHDFVVVETVDYQQFEVGNFPAPTTPDEVGARVLMQERIEDGEDVEMQIESDGDDDMPNRSDNDKERSAKDNNQVQDMEEDSSDEESTMVDMTSQSNDSMKKDTRSISRDQMQPPPLPPTPGNVLVKKGYDPKQQNVNKISRPVQQDEYLISPLTGERILASKMPEHMRIGLLDPRWVEQRDKNLDKLAQETVFAPGTAIEATLKQFAERRTDIFGVGDEETAIGKKIGEEDKRKDDKVTWDGHTSSVEAATRAARANITLEEQIHQIHKVKGLLPDEEKEKIGPKPVTSRAMELSHMAAAASKPQATLKAPPKPPAPKPPQPPQPSQQLQQQPPLPPPPPPQMSMAPMMPPQPPMMPPQPPMMMMAPMPSIRPPPPLMAPGMNPVMNPNMSPFMQQPQPPMQPPMPPPQMTGMKHSADSTPMDDEPQIKKLRTEDSLIPEAQFIARNKGPVNLNIVVPLMTEKTEWKLNGQTIVVTLLPNDTVATMKARISELTGMPPGKQKLQYEVCFIFYCFSIIINNLLIIITFFFFKGMFFKDNNTMAYYNLATGNSINLQPKERGGRKK